MLEANQLFSNVRAKTVNFAEQRQENTSCHQINLHRLKIYLTNLPEGKNEVNKQREGEINNHKGLT